MKRNYIHFDNDVRIKMIDGPFKTYDEVVKEMKPEAPPSAESLKIAREIVAECDGGTECTCDEGYSVRGKRDPYCRWHQFGEDAVKAFATALDRKTPKVPSEGKIRRVALQLYDDPRNNPHSIHAAVQSFHDGARWAIEFMKSGDTVVGSDK